MPAVSGLPLLITTAAESKSAVSAGGIAADDATAEVLCPPLSQTVMVPVLSNIGHELQVLWPIIESVAVDVVNKFTDPEGSTENVFHDDAVFVRPATLWSDLHDPVCGESYAVESPRSQRSRSRMAQPRVASPRGGKTLAIAMRAIGGIDAAVPLEAVRAVPQFPERPTTSAFAKVGCSRGRHMTILPGGER